MDLGNALVPLPLRSLCPANENRCFRQPEWKSMLGG